MPEYLPTDPERSKDTAGCATLYSLATILGQMEKKLLLATFLSIVTISATSFAEIRPRHRFVDLHIAGFRAGVDEEAKVIELYGEGTTDYLALDVENGFRYFLSHCYFFEKESSYLKVTSDMETKKITKIELSYHNNGERCEKITYSKKLLKTGKGIYLGMRLKQILFAYGLPQQMYIEKLTPEELLIFAKKRAIPEGMSAKEFADILTAKRETPVGLSKGEFIIAFENPEQILGIYKTAVYEWRTNSRRDPDVSGDYFVEVYLNRGRLIKISIQDDPER